MTQIRIKMAAPKSREMDENAFLSTAPRLARNSAKKGPKKTPEKKSKNDESTVNYVKSVIKKVEIRQKHRETRHLMKPLNTRLRHCARLSSKTSEAIIDGKKAYNSQKTQKDT